MRLKAKFDEFLQGVLRPEHEGHRKIGGITQFLPVDIDQFKAELELVKQGTSRGKEERPPTDTHHLDAVEQSIVTAIETEVTKATEAFASALNTVAHRIMTLDLRGRSTEIEVRAKDAITEFERHVHEGLDTLHNERRAVAEVELELREFKERHKLRRSAHYPDSKIYHISIIVALFLIEAFCNGLFFAKGNEMGIIGGVGFALAVAAVNISMGFSLGYFSISFLHHRNWAVKIVGAVIGPVLLALIGGLNIFIAHYRDALGGVTPEQAGQIALASMQGSPFQVKDFESWILSAIGFIFSLIAALDGYKFDEPYPGYGRIARKVAAKSEIYAQDKADLIADLQDTRDEAVEKMIAVRKEISLLKGTFVSMLGTRDQIRSNYRAHLDHLESAANDLLRTYRDANLAARSTPIPAHFSDNWQLRRPSEPELDPFSGLTPTIFDEETAKAVETLQRYIDEMNMAFLRAMERYKLIEQLSLAELENGTGKKQAAPVAA